jgi:hypothetical protein
MAAASEFKGYHASVATDSLGGTTIGKVHGFTFSVNNNVVASFVAGSRTADNILEGNQEFTGTITMALRDKTEILDLVTASTPANDTLYVRLDDDITSNETVDLTLNSVRWDTWSTEFDDTGTTVLETATFLCTTVTVGEITN